MTKHEARRILGISSAASNEEEEAAFKKLAAANHPDRHGDALKFQQASEAIRVLRSLRSKPKPRTSSSLASEFRSYFQRRRDTPEIQTVNCSPKDEEAFMSVMKESGFQKWLKDGLEGGGAMVLNVHGHGFQEGGWPDLQVYHRLWTGHLELKVEGNKMSALQMVKIRELRRRGTAAYCCTKMRDGRIILTDHEGEMCGGWEAGELQAVQKDRVSLARLLLERLRDVTARDEALR